jgi:hypothetical protein
MQHTTALGRLPRQFVSVVVISFDLTVVPSANATTTSRIDARVSGVSPIAVLRHRLIIRRERICLLLVNTQLPLTPQTNIKAESL